MRLSTIYDLINVAIFLPWGGSRRPRHELVRGLLCGRARVALLRRAASGLVDGSGRIGLLEWAEPAGRLRGRMWRRFLARLEPSPSVPEILDGALADAGVHVVDRRDRVRWSGAAPRSRSRRVGP